MTFWKWFYVQGHSWNMYKKHKGPSNCFCLGFQGRQHRRLAICWMYTQTSLVNWQFWKPSKAPYRLISNRRENYCGISVKVGMELNVPNFFGKQQWNVCTSSDCAYSSITPRNVVTHGGWSMLLTYSWRSAPRTLLRRFTKFVH